MSLIRPASLQDDIEQQSHCRCNVLQPALPPTDVAMGGPLVRPGRYRNDPYRATVLPQLLHAQPAAVAAHYHQHQQQQQQQRTHTSSIPPMPVGNVTLPLGTAPHLHLHHPLPPVQPSRSMDGPRRHNSNNNIGGGGFASRKKHDIAQAANYESFYHLQNSSFRDDATSSSETPSSILPVGHQYQHDLYVHVRLKHDSQCYLGAFPLRIGDYVVVEADRGVNIGMVERVTADAPSYRVVSRAVRVAYPTEVMALAALRLEEQEVSVQVQHCAQSLKLPMTVIDVEFQFDRNKLTVFFQSDVAVVDFRKLQRSLFKQFGCRIWLIAQRDIAAATS